MNPGNRIRFDHGAFGDRIFHLVELNDVAVTVVSAKNVTYVFNPQLFSYLQPNVVDVAKKKRAKNRAS